MPSDRAQLLDMGFEPDRVDWALRATKNAGLQPAMDHLLAHGDDPVPDPSSTAAPSAAGAGEAMDEDDEEDAEALRAALGKSGGLAAAAAAASADVGSAEGVEARSIKCTQCDKIFKNRALANYHAEKSGHDQFEESTEEIKPLTDEEKKARLEELRAKMAEKRAVKSKQEAEENKANDAIKRKAGKDMGKIKEEMKLKEAVKAAEQAKRDKIADAKAKAAVKAQIEADKRERAEKAAREKALREGNVVAATPAAAAPSTTTASSGGSGEKKEYKETRLQIRLASGGQAPVLATMPSESTLQEVAEHLAGQVLSVDVETVAFSLTFPRKQFARSDFSKTLKDLGLTPSAVLIAS